MKEITAKKAKVNNRRWTEIDKIIGERIRHARSLCEMSQEVLASKLGITFQQLQKYENGTNRVSAARLWEIANILKQPIQWFYKIDVANGNKGLVINRHEATLLRGFRSIGDQETRKSILALVRLGEARTKAG